MKKTYNKQIKWGILLVFTVIIGLLLIMAVASYPIKNGNTFFGGHIRTEVFGFIAISLIILLVLLSVLLLVLRKKKEVK